MKHLIGLNIPIGAWLVAAPLTLGNEIFSPAHALNNVMVGLIVVGCSAMVLADMPGQIVWSTFAIACGLWLTTVPLLASYEDDAFGNDAILGALMLLIGSIEAWRLRKATRAA